MKISSISSDIKRHPQVVKIFFAQTCTTTKIKLLIMKSIDVDNFTTDRTTKYC